MECWALRSHDLRCKEARALKEEEERTWKKQCGAKRTPTSFPDPTVP